ncbi:oligopeptide transport system permease protein [Micromonospora pallida]|uniref:Oligopeptide transport system permease protein n=1 Tax=Micromonospora pallida TaxID=145854 RepID=A0A1C6SFQ3_9ACTN|nr:ABC transporter permease [Micromonospora pallida]SCL28169.1 oligopeptide transport system permease protein [Micromonospora pallida]
MTVDTAKIDPVSDDAPKVGRRWSHLRRDVGFWTGSAIIGLFLLVAAVPWLFAGLFGNGDPDACALADSRRPPAPGHPFGFTIQGCDMYAHVLHGASNSIAIGLLAAGLAGVLGTTVGLVTGYFGGGTDALLSRLAEIVFAFPMVLGAIVILASVSSRGVVVVSVTLGILSWVPMMRVVRSATIAAKARSYVRAAQAMGRPTVAIIVQHILPNVLGPILVIFTTSIGVIIGAESTLTYLGIGLQVPAISWGLQLGSAQSYFSSAPHLLVFPVLALGLSVAGFILLGDAIRRAFGVQRDAI